MYLDFTIARIVYETTKLGPKTLLAATLQPSYIALSSIQYVFFFYGKILIIDSRFRELLTSLYIKVTPNFPIRAAKLLLYTEEHLVYSDKKPVLGVGVVLLALER